MARKGINSPPGKEKKLDAPVASETVVGAALADATRKNPDWKPGISIPEANPTEVWEGEGGMVAKEKKIPGGAFSEEEFAGIVDETIKNIPDTLPSELRKIFGDEPVPPKIFEKFRNYKRNEKKHPKELERFLANIEEARAREDKKRREREATARDREEKKKSKKHKIDPPYGPRWMSRKHIKNIDTKNLDINLLELVPEVLPGVQQHGAEEQEAIDKRIAAAHPFSITHVDIDLSEPAPTPLDIDLGEPAPATTPEPAVARAAEGTPLEQRSRLRELVGKLVGGTKEKFNWWKSSEEHLIRRSAELDAQAEKIGWTEKKFRSWGESYNKLPFKYKVLIGASLGIGTAASAGTLAMALPLLGIAAQRVTGLASMYLKYEKNSHEEKWGKNTEWGKQKAMLKAGLYTLLLGLTMKETIELASETELARAAQAKIEGWLGSMLGHGEARPGFQAEVRAVDNATVVEPRVPGFQAEVRAIDNVTVEPKTTGFQADVRAVDIATEPRTTGFQSEVRTLDNVMLEPENAASQADIRKVDIALETPIAPATPAALEMPSVEATKGKGYEYMMKRMWEQLQTKGLNPNDYTEGSDIRRLLEADAKSIDTVVHQIASDPQHTFYNPNGTSVRINLEDKMTINADGNIQLGDAVKAPEGAPVTPPYPPSPAVSAPSAPISLEQVSPTIEAQPNVGTQPPAPVEVVPGVLQEQSPAPVEERVPSPVIGENTWVNSEGQPWRASDAPVTTGADEVPAPPYAEGTTVNQFGLTIPTTEAHIYASADATQTFVYGGSAAERAEKIREYLITNPQKAVFGPDANGAHRIPYYLGADGKITAGLPVEKSWFAKILSSDPWVEAPKPDEFQKLIK